MRTGKSKKEIALDLLPILAHMGYDGASIKLLADKLGIAKASLYHHFPNGKEEIFGYCLAISGQDMQRRILAPLSDGSLSAEDAIRASIAGVRAYYAGERPSCLMNSLMVGSGYTLFSDQIAAALSEWQRLIAIRFMELGDTQQLASEAAEEFIASIQGILILNTLKSGRNFFERKLADLEDQILNAI